MDTVSRFSLKAEVLSPVHVGDGTRLTPLEYVLDGNKLKVYSFEDFLKKVEEKPRQLRENILLEFKTSGNQQRSLDLRVLLSRYNINLKERYTLPIEGSLTTREVESFIKNLQGPYVPGSEIKGALRVLFISGVLKKDERLYKKFEEKLSEWLNNRSRENAKKIDIASVDKWLERMVYNPRGEEKPTESLKVTEANLDLFRALSISDSKPINYQNLRIEVPELVGSSRGRLNACEALKPGTTVEFTLTIDKRAIQGIRSLLKSGSYPYWDYLDLKKLAELSRLVYASLIDMEIEFFKRKGRSTTVEHLKSLKGYLNDNGILLRIGKHEGYLSTTVMAVVREKNPQLFEDVFKSAHSNARQEVNKTRRVNEKGLTFGWIVLYYD